MNNLSITPFFINLLNSVLTPKQNSKKSQNPQNEQIKFKDDHSYTNIQMSDKDGSRSLGKKSPHRLKNDNSQSKSPLNSYLHRNSDDSDSLQENKKLRKKLKELSIRLDQQLGKAAQLRLKRGNNVRSESGKQQWVQAELQNANKMIQRLQKAVKDYESKQSYQVTAKRVMDLEGIIRKKQKEAQQLKNQLKVNRKIIMERDKDIEQLIRKSGKEMNPAQDLQAIHKMKLKLKKKIQENQTLRKKQVQKHQKLIQAEKALKEMEQDQQSGPVIGAQKDVRKEIEQFKNKYKQAMATIEKQNIEISKLNAKLKTTSLQKKERKQQAIRRSLINSLQELPMISLPQYPSEQQLSPKQNRLYVNRY